MNKAKNMLIGEMLLEEGIITKEQLKDALEEQKKSGEKIGQVLVKMRYISKEILWTFLGYQMGVPFINLDETGEIKQDVLRSLPEQLMRNEKLIPVGRQGRVITVAMADPLNFLVVDDIKATTRSEIDTRLAAPEDIKKLIDKYFGFKDEETGEIAKARIDELDDILAAPMGNRQAPREEAQMKISRSPYGDEPSAQQPSREDTQKPRQSAYASQPSYNSPPQQPSYNPPSQPSYTPPQQSYNPPQPSYNPPAYQEAPQQSASASMSGDTPVNSFLTALISNAYDANATDIHVEPFNDKCRIRRRIDGALYEVDSPPKTLYTGLLNKIKEMAQLNVNEKNAPQESKL
jgi:type II secretory ATPase GspE/PulE/Tfp pilus assembly ATPase PilB-like protein